MLIRAVIVLLVVLNVGVAAWWLGRTEPPPPAPPAQPAGVAVLDIVRDTPSRPSPSTSPSAPAPLTDANVCLRLGPFADRSVAEQASSRLGTTIVRARSVALPPAGASGYRVLVAPAADRATAQATADRIRAAGFDDLLIVNDGAEANAIALGRYRGRETALRRQAELAAGGFAAEIRAVGRDAAPEWWLDVAALPAVTAAALQQQSGAAQAQPQDCAALR